jgi:hypothetical protein
MRLDVMDRVEHDHAFGNAGGVVAELAPVRIATPDAENGRAHFISSMTCFNSARISGIASRRIRIVPSSPFQTIVFTFANSSLFSG